VATLNLPAKVLGRYPQYGARLVARGYLRRVLMAAARITPQAPPASRRDRIDDIASTHVDPEAIHDFRVALRRLRSWLRAWRPLLRASVSPDVERELQRLSRLAGRARDLDVQQLHLADIIARGPRERQAGAQWLARRVAVKRRRAHEALAAALPRDMAPAAARLSAQLRHDRLRIEPDRAKSQATMATALAALLVAQSTRVADRLRRVRTRIAAAHRARIAVKRLRYLLESLEQWSLDARLATRRLTRIQQDLGELHDLQLLAAQDAVQPATRPRRNGASARARVVLRQHVQADIAAAFRRAKEAVRARAVERALAPVRRVVRSLSKVTAATTGTERKPRSPR